MRSEAESIKIPNPKIQIPNHNVKPPKWLGRGFFPELQTIVMKRIAHPGAAESKRREALVVLRPNLFILERICFAQSFRNVPRQRVNLAALLYVFDDDSEVGFVF